MPTLERGDEGETVYITAAKMLLWFQANEVCCKRDERTRMKTSEEMTSHLLPFGERPPSDLGVTCTIERPGTILHITFTIQGSGLSDISIPPPAPAAERRHRLWEGTCLECFIAGRKAEAYREFNLSPSGHWNVYHFDAYRCGMREEDAFSSLPVQVYGNVRALHLSCRIDLQTVGLACADLDVGLAAVLASKNGKISYWATIHARPRPDFHYRESFTHKVDA